ncbi:hypothetical protein [Flavobacterium sp. '19STA2R22 D10 B1']|uniref:hypothetical protein n=1 Tax=Flavobacterium aerium TaxID=3037261 RepID=UPI00278C3A81|nr:hypothetical protein [Flavobacterium sp. '19STA2R22 D10 B1']
MRNPYPIAIGGLFADPEAIFYISHHISRIIREHLECRIIDSVWFDEKYGTDSFLSLKDSSVLGQLDLEVKGPEVSKRYKVVSYSLRMPHDLINSDVTKYEVYLTYHERGVAEIFENLQIKLSEQLHDIYEKIRMEIQQLPQDFLNNPD